MLTFVIFYKTPESDNAVLSQLSHFQEEGEVILEFGAASVVNAALRQCDRKRPCGRCTQLGLVRLSYDLIVERDTHGSSDWTLCL